MCGLGTRRECAWADVMARREMEHGHTHTHPGLKLLCFLLCRLGGVGYFFAETSSKVLHLLVQRSLRGEIPLHHQTVQGYQYNL